MKYTVPALFGVVILNFVISNAANASQFRLPEEIGRVEGPRDMNIFQVEPTIIHERYYSSGQSERHQFVGNVLPAGAEIPDNDAPVPGVKSGSKPESKPAK